MKRVVRASGTALKRIMTDDDLRRRSFSELLCRHGLHHRAQTGLGAFERNRLDENMDLAT